jgi:hypothetical protein
MLNRRFVSRSVARLSADEAHRQGAVTKLAVDMMGASAAITFLNSVSPVLSDRPLSVAVASEDGFQAVARLIAQDASDAAIPTRI